MNRVYTILVLMGILGLLMIGVYKSSKESVVETTIEDEYIEVHSNEEEFIEESYFLVIGSFTNIYNAETYQSTMSDLGYETKILKCDDGYHRVYLFSSIYKEEVYQTKDQYSQEIDKMWVYNFK